MAAPVAYPGTLTFYAGTGNPGTAAASGTAATSSALQNPQGTALDSSGNLYIADTSNALVEKVDTSGVMTYVAGNGTGGTPTSGGSASQSIGQPTSVAVDGTAVYFTDRSSRVYKVDSGTITRVAASHTFNQPTGLAVDSSHNLYVADTANHLVKKVDTSGTVTVVAGTGSAATSPPSVGATHVATSTALKSPRSVAVDGSGNVYIADRENYVVEKVTPTGDLTVVAGTGAYGTGRLVAGTATARALGDPKAIGLDTSGNLYVVDNGRCQVAMVAPAGQLSVIAGTGTCSSAANNADATATGLYNPFGVTPVYDPFGVTPGAAGVVYITDLSANRIYKVTPKPGTVPAVTSSAPTAAATFGVPYSFTPAATGSPSLTWTKSSGSLPAGLTLDPTTGAIGGSPTAAGTSTFTLRVATTAGYDEQAASIVVAPVMPGHPTGVSATAGAAGTGSAVVSWTAPASNGGAAITSYTVTASSGGATCTTATTSCTVTGLTGGTAYSFAVTASNSAGASTVSPFSSPVTPTTVPGVPTGVSATAGAAGTGSAVVSWTAPANNGGAAITSYTVTASPGGTTCTTATTSCTVSGLTAGTAYTFSVAASNSVGASVASASSSPTTPAAPPSGGGASTATPQVSTTAPKTVGLGSRTFALNATSTSTGAGSTAAGGSLGYTSATPSVCTVNGTGVVTALKAGTCSVTITAPATATSGPSTTTVDVTITGADASVAALPAGPQRFAGSERVATSASIAEKVFPTPPTGTSLDVVIATAGSYADALPGSRLAGQVGGPLLLTDGNTLSDEAAAQVKRLVAAGGTVYLLGGDKALSDAVEKATAGLVTGDTVVRLGGDTRYETAATIADATVKKAGDVGPIYLVTGRDFADGVSVGAYAQSTGGVVLLTDGDTMPAATAKYLADHDPKGERAIAVGGPAKAAAAGAGLSGAASRAVVGADRYETSAKLAAAMKTTTGSSSSSPSSTPVSSVGLAGGASWPDALSGSAAMAALGGPLLLTPTASETVPAATTSALSGLDAKRVLVFGGTSVITGSAFDKAGSLLGS